MAAAKALISLEYSVLSSLKCTSRATYTLNFSIPCINTNQLFYHSRFISTKSYLAKERDDSGNKSGDEKQNENEKRADLERLKKLLLQQRSRAKTADNILNAADQRRLKQRKAKAKAGTSIQVTQITDMLSSLKLPREHSPGYQDKPPIIIEKKMAEATESSINHVVSIKSTRSVKADKLKDALSSLGQDSSSTEEEVVMAGRHISLDSKSSIEGAYNIKHQQYHDKVKRKKITRSSLRIGPRYHLFDKVREKWPQEQEFVDTSIFQEMAEQEVKDLGMSTTVQSGFHDLMDIIDRQWAFPVDNEVCKVEEEAVGFDEHVFLEHLLDDFPKAGNIRQFMELVVTGLQQNPYLSVEDKKEHIEWFKDYFQNIPDEQVQL